MGQFVSNDDSVMETPIEAAMPYYTQAPEPGHFQEFADLVSKGPTEWLQRAVAHGSFEGAQPWETTLYNIGVMQQPEAWQMHPEMLKPTVTPMQTAAEINAKAPPGVKITDQPMEQGLADDTLKDRWEDYTRDQRMARFEQDHWWGESMGMGFAAFMLDPFNVATTVMPGIGEEWMLARLGEGALARFAARGAAGFASGALAQAPLSALQYGLRSEEGAGDYGLRQAFLDMAFAGAGGAVLHAGFGIPGDWMRSRADARYKARLEAMPIPPQFSWFGAHEGEAPVLPKSEEAADLEEMHLRHVAYSAELQMAREPLGYEKLPYEEREAPDLSEHDLALEHQYLHDVAFGADLTTRYDAMKTALAQLMDGRAVDVMPVFDEAGHQRDVALRKLDFDINSIKEKMAAAPPEDKTLPGRLAQAEELEQRVGQRAREAMGAPAPEELRQQVREAEAARATRDQNLEAISRLERKRGAMEKERDELARKSAASDAAAILEKRERMTPAEVVEEQRRFYRDGFQVGVPQKDWDAWHERVADWLKGEAPQKVTPEATRAAASEEKAAAKLAVGEKPEEKAPGEGAEAAVGTVSSDVAKDVARLQAEYNRRMEGVRMFPWDKAELRVAQEGVDHADTLAQGMADAAACLVEANV